MPAQGDQPAPDLGIPGLEVAEQVGQGGFARVYRARQPAFDREVAVKVLDSRPDEAALERFQREIRAMGSLGEHPSIVALHDAGTTASGAPYLIMPFFSGGSYADALAGGLTLTWREACEVGATLAHALQAAHDAGVLHRDLKPANVLLGRYGNPMLADFGIARIAGGPQTTTGVVTASLAHAAPEVLNGQRPSVASDVYGLCSTLVALLTGRGPFEQTTDETVLPLITRTLTEPPPRLPDVPDALNDLLAQGLAKDPAERIPDARTLGESLQAVAEGRPLPPRAVPAASGGTSPGATVRGPSSGPPPVPATGSTGQPPAAAGRPPRAVWVGAAVALVLVLVVAGLATRGGEEPDDTLTVVEEPTPNPPVDGSAGSAPESGAETAVDLPRAAQGTPPIEDDTLTGGADADVLRGIQEFLGPPVDPLPVGLTDFDLGPGEWQARQVVVPAGQVLRLFTTGEEVDPILALFTPAGLFVLADDDRGGGESGHNALLDLPVMRAGPLTVAVYNLDEQAGTTTVGLVLIDAPRPLRPGRNDGVISDADPIQAWTVQVGGGGAQPSLVTMTGETFDSYLRLIDDRGRPRAETGGSASAAIDLRALGPGTYTLLASDDEDPETTRGPYTITLE